MLGGEDGGYGADTGKRAQHGDGRNDDTGNAGYHHQERNTVDMAPSILARTRQKQFGPGDSITQTGYCVGCLRSSVDMPGTARETWYCRRNQGKDGVIVFRRISSGVVVRQCRYRIEEIV